MNTVEKTRKEVLELLESYEIDVAKISEDGVDITKNLMVRIVDIIRSNSSYSSVRGHAKYDERFNISYETKYLSYERLSDEFYLGGATISYGSSENTYKLFVSDGNWIDIHINYDEKSYATIVIVPKSKWDYEKEEKEKAEYKLKKHIESKREIKGVMILSVEKVNSDEFGDEALIMYKYNDTESKMKISQAKYTEITGFPVK